MSANTDTDPSDSDIVEELREALERPDIDPEAEADRVDAALEDALGSTAADDIPKEIARTSLPEVLLALLEIRTAERHGGVLLEDFARSFSFNFSPGTVYPVLHDLADAGLLEAKPRAASKKKDYQFQDPEAAYTRIEQRAEQHAALARFLHGALEARES